MFTSAIPQTSRRRIVKFAPPGTEVSADEAGYLRTKAVDDLVFRLDLKLREASRDDDSCVCPKYYPQYWQ